MVRMVNLISMECLPQTDLKTFPLWSDPLLPFYDMIIEDLI